MASSSARIATTIVAMLLTASSYWATFRPGSSSGPFPILLWQSIPVVIIGGLALGVELRNRLSLTHRVTTALVQLVSIAVIQTVGMVIGWRLDPAFFDPPVVRTYYGIPLILGTPVVILYHGIGWLQTHRDQ